MSGTTGTSSYISHSILDDDMRREILNLSTDSDTASEVPTVSAAPRASFMDTILTPMLSKEIDDLSGDSDSDFDDFSPEKGYERALKMLKPKERLLPPLDDVEFAKMIQFRHVTRYFIDLLPEQVRAPCRRVRTLMSALIMKGRNSDGMQRLRAAYNITIGIISTLWHILYQISFSWQYILTSVHSGVLYSDSFWTKLLDDRMSMKEQADNFDKLHSSVDAESWRDSYDIRVSEFTPTTGTTGSLAVKSTPGHPNNNKGAVNGKNALETIRSNISVGQEKQQAPAAPVLVVNSPGASEAEKKEDSDSLKSLESFDAEEFTRQLSHAGSVRTRSSTKSVRSST